MMKNHSWLNFLVFTCFLVIGYTFSGRFYAHGSSIFLDAPRVLAGSENSIESMPNGQRTLLLIGSSSVDTAAAQLERIWLASYFPSEATLRIYQVYPSGNAQATPLEDQLHSSFKLARTSDGLIPDPAFMEILQANNFWWSGYFIFDAQAFSSFVSQGASLLAGQESGDHTDSLGSLATGSSGQLYLLQSACQKFFITGQGVSISQLLSLFKGHYLTDLPAEVIQQEWDGFYSGEQNPTCRFPKLEISRLEP